MNVYMYRLTRYAILLQYQVTPYRPIAIHVPILIFLKWNMTVRIVDTFIASIFTVM